MEIFFFHEQYDSNDHEFFEKNRRNDIQQRSARGKDQNHLNHMFSSEIFLSDPLKVSEQMRTLNIRIF